MHYFEQLRRRARLVDHFNQEASVDVFLLTTKVGGIGINLTGADRSAAPAWVGQPPWDQAMGFRV